MTSGSWRRMLRRALGEGQADRLLDVGLVDQVELVFDRVFDGDDVQLGAADQVQRGIERGRLAAAGRAGDQDQAVRLV